MNVAHCIHGLGLGGAQKVIASIVRGRQDETLRYFVYSCNDGVHRQEIEEAGATVRVIPRHIAKLDPLWVAGLARAMRRDRIDLVHCHLFGDSLHGYLATRLAGDLPVILTLHNRPEGFSGLQRRGYRWLLARCARAVACSVTVARAFDADGLASRLATLPNGLEPPAHDLPAAERQALRAGFGADPETIVLAAVGRLVPAKGYSDLIEAYARLGAELDTRLVLVGDGPLRSDLEDQVRRAGLGDRVVLTGFRGDVPSVLQAIDVMVFSSLWEGLPIALLEAMAYTRCIVTTDVPGIIEAVRDRREALVVPIGEPARLAAALELAATDPALREQLATAARHRYQTRYTADVMVHGYETLYQEVLGAGQS